LNVKEQKKQGHLKDQNREVYVSLVHNRSQEESKQMANLVNEG